MDFTLNQLYINNSSFFFYWEEGFLTLNTEHTLKNYRYLLLHIISTNNEKAKMSHYILRKISLYHKNRGKRI